MSEQTVRTGEVDLSGEPEATPRCRHFGTCGGCQLQHLSQKTQLQQKAAALMQRLQTSGVVVAEICTHAADEYGYRNRIRLRVVDGQVGYNRRASNDFLSIVECPIAAPVLWRAAGVLQEIAAASTLWPRGSAEVELCTDAAQSALQLLLHVDATVSTLSRDAPQQFRALCVALEAKVPQLLGGGLLVQGELQAGSRRVQERQRVEVARWGVPQLRYHVGGTDYDVTRGAFFQVNRFLTERMVELVTAGRAGEVAWDLFAGAGLFSVPLASRFRSVTAVEVGQPAASDLAAALQRCGGQHRALAVPVAQFLNRPVGPSPALVVLDPPRAGLGVDLAQQLARTQASEIVYISCDAGTFARDARALIDSRYAVTELHLLDLFPQTHHTETIAVFRRS